MAAGTTFRNSVARGVAACSMSVLATLAVSEGFASATESVPPPSSDVADPTLGTPASLPAETTVAPDPSVPAPTTVPATVTPTVETTAPPTTSEPSTTLIPAVSMPEPTTVPSEKPSTTLIPAASFPEVIAVPAPTGDPVTTLIPAASMPERVEPNSTTTTDGVADISGPAEVAPVRPAPIPVAAEAAPFDPVEEPLPSAGSSSSSQPVLPATGAETDAMLLIAALGVLGGVSLVALSRRGVPA